MSRLKYVVRPTGVGRESATYTIPIEGRDEWLAGCEAAGMRERVPAQGASAAGDAAPDGRACRLRRRRRVGPRRGRTRGYQAQHRQAAPRRPTSAVGTDDRAADPFGPRPWLARRPEPGASVIS